MTCISADFLRDALREHLSAAVEVEGLFKGVETDSRKSKDGALFVALAGDRFDGHDFVVDVLRKNSGAALVHKRLPQYEAFGAKVIEVQDTLKALQQLARAHLQTIDATRIGVTGSNGKTTTKELIRGALSGATGPGFIHANAGNFNNHIGLPLSALKADVHHRFVILEMGMNHLGEIAELAGIGQPQIGVITNIGSAHAGNLGGISGVAQAKGELFEYLAGTDGVLVVNADDPRCIKQAKRWPKARTVQFGKSKLADVQIASVAVAGGGLQVVFKNGEHSFPVQLPLVGLHNAWNAAAAMAVALAGDVPLAQAAKGMESVLPSAGRLQHRALDSGVIVLDDTYNANPESMEMGLQTLMATQAQRRIVVLGEMLELGDMAVSSHRSIGAAVAQKK